VVSFVGEEEVGGEVVGEVEVGEEEVGAVAERVAGAAVAA
jgi:hypothetical protein